MVDITSSNGQSDNRNKEDQLEIGEPIREDRYHQHWIQLIKVIEISVIAIVALLALKFGLDYLIQNQRIELERQAKAALQRPPKEKPTEISQGGPRGYVWEETYLRGIRWGHCADPSPSLQCMLRD